MIVTFSLQGLFIRPNEIAVPYEEIKLHLVESAGTRISKVPLFTDVAMNGLCLVDMHGSKAVKEVL
jgi:hypothetical protein